MSSLLRVLSFIFLCFLSFPLQGSADQEASVAWVSDGDSLVVRVNGRLEKVRLIGLDAPELGQGEWGRAAKRHLQELIGRSKRITLEFDIERRDKYGRMLAYVRTSEGVLANTRMLGDGYAVLLTLPPNTKHVREFVEAEQRARERKAGLWKTHAFENPPSEYRKKHPRK